MKYIVDTHALIWFLEGNPRLGIRAKAILSDLSSELILPAIALAESVWIVSRGKTSTLVVQKQGHQVALYIIASNLVAIIW
jgi:PIN domain nuclease of toxin-antitoxin system